MNYQQHYNTLIERARSRTLLGYSERHHIVPRCIGGNNTKENIVRLTPSEHYVAHQLLMKLHPENIQLVLAVKMMSVSGGNVVRNNKLYGWLKRKYSAVMSARVVKESTRQKMSDNAKNRYYSEETRRKMAESGKNRKSKYKGISVHTPESKKLISEAGKRPCKESTKIKISLANTGRKLSPVTEEKRNKLSVANTGHIHDKVVCPHCGTIGGITGMKRWHFEKCKDKND